MRMAKAFISLIDKKSINKKQKENARDMQSCLIPKMSSISRMPVTCRQSYAGRIIKYDEAMLFGMVVRCAPRDVTSLDVGIVPSPAYNYIKGGIKNE